MSNTRLIGVVLQDAEIDGLVTNLVVNGVEVMRATSRRSSTGATRCGSCSGPTTPPTCARAIAGWWPTWAATVERMRATPGIEHRSVERRVVGRARRCATWSSSTTPGSAGAARLHRRSSRRWAWGSRPSPTARSRASTRGRPDARRGARGPRRAGGRARGVAGRGHARAPRRAGSRARRRPLAAVRPRPERAASASAPCSPRSASTTASACATSTCCRLRSTDDTVTRVARVSEMTYRPLGDSGLMVSVVGIGCNAFGRRVDLDGVREILDAAQDVGVTLLDTADVYGGDGRERGDDRRGDPGPPRRLRASPPSSAWTCRARTAPTTAPAARAPTYAVPSRRRCAGCASTTSTSTSTTSPTR